MCEPVAPQAGTPTVGRTVHQVAHGAATGKYPLTVRMAQITSVVNATTLNLFVITDQGEFHDHNVPYHGGWAPGDEPDELHYRDPHDGRAYPPGTWHWPPRVPG